MKLAFLGRAAIVAALLSGTAANAQVTAEDVWKSWTDYYASLGQAITAGSEEKQGDTLVVTDAKVASEVAEGSLTITIPEVRLKELGDGRVEVTMAPSIPVTSTSKLPDGKMQDMAMTVSNTGLVMIASGTPENLSYDVTAPEIKVAITEMKVDGAPVPMNFDMTLTNNTGKYQVSGAAPRAIVSEFAADTLSLAVGGTNPEDQSTFNMTANYNGLSGNSNATLPDGIDMADMNAAIRAGFAADGTFNYTGGSFKVDFTDASGPGSVSGTDGGGAFNFAMAQDGLTYGGGSKALALSVAAPNMPPMDAQIAETAFNLQMPLAKSDTAQPMGMVVKLIDLTLSDAIWGMFDPTSQLPRDPATLIVDVSATGKLLVDFLDPALQAEGATPPEMPAELESAKINQLQVKAVGAELTGTGDMTFDNSTGTPMPIGAIDLQLTGANALIQKLVAMGIIPEDQAMGAQMMLGMFAVPAGDDVLTSKIEFKEGGSIFANGQQIQ